MTTIFRLAIVAAAFMRDCDSFTLLRQQQQQLQPHYRHDHKRVRFKLIRPTQLFGSYFDEEPEDIREFAKIRRGRKGRTFDNQKEEDNTLLDELEDVVDDYFNSQVDDDDYQGIIPNPLLDNIDPEGSTERMGELLTDKQFWIDIGLLLLFLNFLDNLRDPAVFDAIDMATM